MANQTKVANSAVYLDMKLNLPLYVDADKGFYNEYYLKWSDTKDSLLVKCEWKEGAYDYQAILGQADPVTGEFAYLGGPVAKAATSEALVTQLYDYFDQLKVQRLAIQQETDAANNAAADSIAEVPASIDVIPASPEVVAQLDEPEAEVEPVIVGDVAEVPAQSEVQPEEPGEVLSVTDIPVMFIPENPLEVPVGADYSELYGEAKEQADEYRLYSEQYETLCADPDHDRELVYQTHQKLAALESALRVYGINPKTLLNVK